MAHVFISYRRDDTGGHAGRLAGDLERRFGRASVFMDIDSIAPGADFSERIREAIAGSDLTLVLIGTDWPSNQPDGTRRLDNPADFVRLEVAMALAVDRSKVVPVLIESATMPDSTTLPAEVADIARLNAVALANSRWRFDVDRISKLVQDHAPGSPVARLLRRALPRNRRMPVLIVTVFVIALGIVAVLSGRGPSTAERVAACERTHGMSSESVRRPPREGESQLGGVAYATCAWPVAAGAEQDGYRAIIVSEEANPTGIEARGDSGVDRIVSRCGQLEIQYSFAAQGAFTNLPPFQALPQEIWHYNPVDDPSRAFARVNPFTNLPFARIPGEVDVIKSSKVSMQRVACLR